MQDQYYKRLGRWWLREAHTATNEKYREYAYQQAAECAKRLLDGIVYSKGNLDIQLIPQEDDES